MSSLNLEFGSQQIPPFGQKVILQYNVYVILCFLHLLLKYDCVGVYSMFKNLFKTFFSSNFVNCSLSSDSLRIIFLVVLYIKKDRMILKNSEDFIITVTWAHQIREA